MRYDDHAAREGFRRGAREAYESVMPYLEPSRVRELAEWLDVLEGWRSGPPPQAPHKWMMLSR